MLKSPLIVAIAGLLLGAVASPMTSVASPARAAPDNTDATTWIYPVITGFGKVHPRPDVAVQPDPGADY